MSLNDPCVKGLIPMVVLLGDHSDPLRVETYRRFWIIGDIPQRRLWNLGPLSLTFSLHGYEVSSIASPCVPVMMYCLVQAQNNESN